MASKITPSDQPSLSKSNLFSTISATSQQPSNWKQLQNRYLEYIKLLKTKLSHAEGKLQKHKSQTLTDNATKLDQRTLALIKLATCIQSATNRHLAEVFHHLLNRIRLTASCDKKGQHETKASLNKSQSNTAEYLQLDSRIDTRQSQRRAVDFSTQPTKLNLQSNTLKRIQKLIKHKEQRQLASALLTLKCAKQPAAQKQKALKTQTLKQLSKLKLMLNVSNSSDYFQLKNFSHQQNNLAPQQGEYSLKTIQQEEKTRFSALREQTKLNVQATNLRKQNGRLNQELQKAIKSKAESLMELEQQIRGYELLNRELEKEVNALRGNHKNILLPSFAELELENHKLERVKSELERIIAAKDNTIQTIYKKLDEQVKHRSCLQKSVSKLSKEVELLKEYKFETEYEYESLKNQQLNLKVKEEAMQKRWAKAKQIENQNTLLQTTIMRLKKTLHDLTLTNDLQKIKSIVSKANCAFETLTQNNREQGLVNSISSATNILNVIEKIVEQKQLESTELSDLDEYQKIKVAELKQKIQHMKYVSASSPNIASKPKDIRRVSLSQNHIDSLLDVFDVECDAEHRVVKPEGQHAKEDQVTVLRLKVIGLETEINHKNNTIMGLKEKAMYTRQIVLQLLSTFDIKNLTAESDGIITILIDIFEYSQDEKNTLFKHTKKGSGKLFGLF